MLSIGWPEMLIVAAAALIIVGPRDLPSLLRQIGKFAGQARRMGNEFRAEINKVAALDDVKDIKKSITQPLKDTERDIQSEFNKVTSKGVEPSGALKPKDPESESVFDEIKSATAKVEEAPDPAQATRDNMIAAIRKGEERRTAKLAEEAAKAAEKALEPVSAEAPAETQPKAVAKPAARKTTRRKAASPKTGQAKTTAAKKPAQQAKVEKPTAEKPKTSAKSATGKQAAKKAPARKSAATKAAKTKSAQK